MKALNAMLLALVFTLFGTVAFASENIAVVDVQKIMQHSSEMEKIKKNLEGQFKPRQEKLVALDAELKQMVEKYKKDVAVMSDSDKKSLEAKITTAQRDLEQQGQAYQKELSAAHNKAMQELFEKVKKVVADVAAKDKYDLVLQKEAATFAEGKLDITAEVEKQLH